MRPFIGYTIIYSFVIITIAIWFYVRYGTPMFTDFDLVTHTLGQLSALAGTVLFLFTFILATRLKIIKAVFKENGSLSRAHHLIGNISFVLLILHPVLLLVKYFPSYFGFALKYLLMGGYCGLVFGIISLVVMIVLAIITLFVKLERRVWKRYHMLFVLLFIFFVIHLFTTSSDLSLYPVLRYYMIGAVSIIAIIYVYFYIKTRFRKKFNK